METPSVVHARSGVRLEGGAARITAQSQEIATHFSGEAQTRTIPDRACLVCSDWFSECDHSVLTAIRSKTGGSNTNDAGSLLA